MPALTIYNIKLKKDKILKTKLSLAPCENCIQLSNISRWAERTLCECIDSSHYQFTSHESFSSRTHFNYQKMFSSI